jgi:hypothetical protein
MGRWRSIIWPLALLAAGSAAAELTPARRRCEYRRPRHHNRINAPLVWAISRCPVPEGRCEYSPALQRGESETHTEPVP